VQLVRLPFTVLEIPVISWPLSCLHLWKVRVNILCNCRDLVSDQGFTKRCRLSWLTNSALVYEPKWAGGSCRVSANEHRSPNKLWSSTCSIFNLWVSLMEWRPNIQLRQGSPTKTIQTAGPVNNPYIFSSLHELGFRWIPFFRGFFFAHSPQ
jgi:hypothetical protein